MFEPLSLDEAYLDVSSSSDHHGSATLIAKDIKETIFAKTQLIASAGVSYNKFLAKIASDMDKPDGLYLVSPEQGSLFVEQLEVGKFHGIGQATQRKMHALGIKTGLDLKQQSLYFLIQNFGKAGQYYYNISRGIDLRPVNNHRITKSVGVETTFQVDILERKSVLQQLNQLLTKALTKLKDKNLKAYSLTIKIKYHDFVQITRGRVLTSPITENTLVAPVFDDLLKNTDVGCRKIRLLGITLSSLEKTTQLDIYQQLDLFELEKSRVLTP